MDEKLLTSKLKTLLDMNDCSCEELYDRIANIKEERDIYYLAMDNCVDSFHLTDGDANVLFINKCFERHAKLTKEEAIGKNVIEMEKSGIYRPSVVRLALEEGKSLTMIQNGPGGDALVTATPIKDENGKNKMCVSNARFIDEIQVLASYFETLQKEKAHTAYRFYDDKKIAYHDEKVKTLYQFAKQIAGTDSSVLITGETGTGKSMLAKFIHENSSRADGEFVQLNCASIPENLIESELFGYESGAFTGANKEGKPGLFEVATHGTLFLDEIGDMPLPLQAKLLSAIQNRKIMRIGGVSPVDVDVRIITATNRDLEQMMDNGEFRSDLYYRINVIPLFMPALRDRKADINAMTDSFISLYNKRHRKSVGITDGAKAVLNDYKWPGNIRELENLMERLVITDTKGLITEEDLPNNIKLMTESEDFDVKIGRLMPLSEALEKVEKELVEMAFKDGSSTYKAAKALGISQSGASRKYMKYIKK